MKHYDKRTDHYHRDHAFLSCPSLQKVTIPASTTLNVDVPIFGGTNDLIIFGTVGSSAYLYAKKNHIAFMDPNATQAETLTLTPETLVLQRGEIVPLTATIEPADAQLGNEISWRTGDSTIALVDENGTVHGIGGGSTVITAMTDNGLTASVEVEVQVAVTDLILKPIDGEQPRGTSQLADLTILPHTATNQTITWTSDDETVASVDEEGMISFLFEGETTITATAHNGAMAQIPVQVFNPVDAIVLHPEEKDLYAVAGRNTLQITAEIQPGDATHQAPSWKSSNINVLTVDQTGLVTALKPGTAVVTATSTDSLAASATIQITVLARDISEMELQSLEPIVYDAQRHVPALELVLDDNTLVLNTDYTLTGEMTNVGENVLTITGIGKYTGTTEITQTITKAQARIEYVGEDTLWPDTLNRVVSFQPGFVRGTVSYAPILADETTGDSLSAPTDSGDYMLSAAVADTDNYDGATLTRIIHYISGDQLSTLEALTLIPGQTVTLPVTSVLEYADPFALTLASGDEVVATAEGLTVQANSAGSCVLTLSVDGSNATAQCILTVVDGLSTMTLPAALTTVEDEAFADDSAVQRIVLGSEVTSIGNRAFAGMTGLVQIEIPESVTSIEDDALNGSDPLILCKRGSYADQWAEANGIDRIYN